ncbi:trimeric intracellular cation channel family protein [Corynebacterium singulare]|uniref:trimeric intracellular cation channel family protein n=1 Tax=Corynebacterium singulare TaxID=161899 RepID=UPI00191C6051|nr:trimeric intracellular cation channel family protein [Corynebacterium singulare]
MQDVDPLIQSLYQAFDLIGVVLNGIIGGTIARRREFDIIGFVFLALFSGLAGGMIRDMLIANGPAAAISDPLYLTLACVGALIAFLTDLKGKAWEFFREHGDAIILGVWSTTGCVKGLANDMPLIACVFLGVLTAVGGGMVRDVASGMIPSVFGGTPLYAVPAVLTGVVMVGFAEYDKFALGMIIAPIVGCGMAITSYWRGWVLPRAGVAPVNYTAAQVAAIAKKAELKGFRRGSKKRTEKKQGDS